MQVMDDMRCAGVDFITIGQYLQPSRKHAPIDRFVAPEEFKALETIAYAKGFLMVAASPLTRSSHHAGEDFERLRRPRAAAPRNACATASRTSCPTAAPAVRPGRRRGALPRVRALGDAPARPGTGGRTGRASPCSTPRRRSASRSSTSGFATRVRLDEPAAGDRRRPDQRPVPAPGQPLAVQAARDGRRTRLRDRLRVQVAPARRPAGGQFPPRGEPAGRLFRGPGEGALRGPGRCRTSLTAGIKSARGHGRRSLQVRASGPGLPTVCRETLSGRPSRGAERFA